MKNNELNKSLKIGTTFVITYIASYYMRNLLGVLTPAMLETGIYTKEVIGRMSSAYMIAYALGQLVNGSFGDRLNTKTMIVSGLFITGLSSVAISLFKPTGVQTAFFAVMGYGLSMLRGPMMKVISENTVPKHARIICAFFSCASFMGAFFAGLLAAVCEWKETFFVAGVIVLIIAAAAYTVIRLLEKRKLIITKYNGGKQNILAVFKINNFIFYMVVGMIVEIAGTSINFWIPTYLTEHLGINADAANMIFVLKSVLQAAAPFIAIAIYNRVKNGIKIVKLSFLVSCLLFSGMIFADNRWLILIQFITALFVSGFASAMIWSVYIPSLNSTGRVSGANGILDCSGYVGAGAANLLFSNLIDAISWNGIVGIWALIMLFGFLTAQIKETRNKHRWKCQ